MLGLVYSVNVSPGGVPKRPVREAWIGPLGLEGDAHHSDQSHGGPHRAVCLFALEAIERVQADGHPIEPGTAGENLTTAGIELAHLPIGTRLAIGDEVEVEIASACMPCATISGAFREGRSGRISILTHPDDSRMYARVLREGTVRTGDPIRVLPALPDTLAETHVLLSRLESVERFSDVSRWRAAVDAGYTVDWSDSGDLAVGASAELEGPHINTANGLRTLPQLVGRVMDRYRAAGAVGYLPMNEPPWPGAVPEFRLVVHVGDPEVAAASPVPSASRLEIRELAADDTAGAAAFARILAAADDLDAAAERAWSAILERLAGAPGHQLFLAELDGRAVAAAMLVRHRKVGLLRATGVIPEARGLGLQRALIAHRARAAAKHHCDTLLAVIAAHNAASRRNVEAAGLRPIWTRDIYRFDPRATMPT